MDGLTQTERIIVAEYISRVPPPKAKELAAELGVSVKTVYKALYKYRKMKKDDPRANTDLKSFYSREEENIQMKEILQALYTLKLSIDQLNNTLKNLINVISDLQQEKETLMSSKNILPSFVEDNPWLEVVSRLNESSNG